MFSIAILASEQWDFLILKNIHASSDFFVVKSIHISLYKILSDVGGFEKRLCKIGKVGFMLK